MLAACWRRNSRQLGPERLGAGPSRLASRIRLIVLGRDAQAELEELAGDPRVAPAWVLVREAQNELSHAAIDGWTARSPLRLRPLATHELSMPAQKRLRRHDQSVATPCRKQSGERRKQSTIGWPQRGAPLLPAQHHQLMSQHEQLDVFGELAAPASDQQPQHSREGEIGERKEHEADAPIARHRGRQERELRSGPASQSVARLSAIWYSRARVNT